MEQVSEERRAQQRVAVFQPLVYQSDADPEPRVAFTRDLSPEGVRIESLSYPYSQERLTLWFSAPPRVIHCRGRVVHVELLGEKFCAGITFESMTEEDRMFLARYLRNRFGEKR